MRHSAWCGSRRLLAWPSWNDADLRTLLTEYAPTLKAAGDVTLCLRLDPQSVADMPAAMARLAVRRARDRTWTKARQRLADDEGRRRMQAELERREAEDVVAALGHMKGAMMKLGQMASYLDEGMPEPMREALAGLRSDAPPMPGDLALSEIEAGLGRPLHELFDRSIRTEDTNHDFDFR